MIISKIPQVVTQNTNFVRIHTEEQKRRSEVEDMRFWRCSGEEWCVLWYTWLGAYGTGRYRCQQAEEAEV